ncbi:glutamate-rich protein 1 isoform X2 [Phyllobates terribilis]|uniref:glutamate-rich protein 1 isoform X2 n=1 Tax=Phyllobates terribilis TaxID=111132 RepID=UPI003CCAD65C
MDYFLHDIVILVVWSCAELTLIHSVLGSSLQCPLPEKKLGAQESDPVQGRHPPLSLVKTAEDRTEEGRLPPAVWSQCRMGALQHTIFLSKVLTRLYPNTADPQTLSSKNETLKVESEEKPEKPIQSSIPEPAENEESNISPVKVYTANLPPDGYIPPPKTDLKPSTTEDSNLEEDQSVEICKRRRRKKKKVNLKNESTSDGQQNIQKTPQALEGGKINKNKKRKLQRKRQKERLKAEGKWTKGRTCQSNMCQEDCTMKQSDEQTEEEERKLREDLLDFLQATQELYFSDRNSRCADSGLMVEQILEILDQIKNGALPFSEVQLLHHLKSLLLLQDIERLNESLGNFKEQSFMPPDYIKALCSLFDYWITNILPIKKKPTK